MDAATIKGVVDRLMKRGYIESTPSATDRRRVLITLTAAGKKAYEHGVGARTSGLGRHAARLKPRERTVLLRLLKRLALVVGEDPGHRAGAGRLTGPRGQAQISSCTNK